MQVEVASIVKQMMSAGERWESALDAHALAPPDAGFPVRLRALSDAAASRPPRSSSPPRAVWDGDRGRSRVSSRWRPSSHREETALAPPSCGSASMPRPPARDGAGGIVAEGARRGVPRALRGFRSARQRAAAQLPGGTRRGVGMWARSSGCTSVGGSCGCCGRSWASRFDGALLALHGPGGRAVRPARWFAGPRRHSVTSLGRSSAPSCPSIGAERTSATRRTTPVGPQSLARVIVGAPGVETHRRPRRPRGLSLADSVRGARAARRGARPSVPIRSGWRSSNSTGRIVARRGSGPSVV